MEAGAEVIATEILLLEIELGKGMSAVDDRLDPFRARHFADGFHRRDLAGNVDLMRHQDQPGAIRDSFRERGCDLVEVLRRDGNLDQLQLQVLAFFALAQSGEHARVILSGGEDFVAGFEIHSHQ